MLITVTDEGPGIPEAQGRAMLDMFLADQQAEGGRSSGLGLAICHGMIGAHGGRIEALPGPRGRGTTITIDLPLPEPPEEQPDG